MKNIRLALLAVAAFVGGTALAQTFGTAQRMYPHTPGVGALSHNAYVDASGNNVYVAWSTFSSGTNCADVWVKISNDNGTTFGAPINISGCTATQTNIAPVIVGDGTSVHVFYMDDELGETNGVNSGVGRILYYRGAQSGNSMSFVSSAVLVSDIGYSRPTSALMNGAQVHLAFYDNRPNANGTFGKVFHKVSCNSGATWQADQDVTQFDGGLDNEQPRLAKLSTGEIFMSYRASRGVPQGGWPPFQIMLLRMNTACAPTQATWLYPAQRLSLGADTDLGPNYAANIFPGLNGGLHAAWWNDTAGTNLVYRYGVPNGKGFGAQQDLSGFGLNHPQLEHMTERTAHGIAEDGGGRTHAVFLQFGQLRGGFQAGNLWYRCAPAPVGTAFFNKQIFPGSSLASEPRSAWSNGRMHVVWQDYRHTAIDQSEIYYNYVTTNACVAPAASVPPTPSQTTVDFGGNSMQTTSSGMTFQLTNSGSSSVAISAINVAGGFALVGTDCSSLAAGASCNVTVNFTPGAQGTVNGTATISNSGGADVIVNLTGVGERSLVTHYYRSILNRAPDGAGKAFWEGEAARLTSLSVDINETWYVMAGYFFNSAEYLAANKNDTQFVADLYNTFFNRAPDGGGSGYWVGQIQGGLPREVVLFSFMFSAEFQAFTQGIFGNTASRPEVNVVMDFFRGILNRLPDTGSFNYWLGRMRTAQCAGAGPVYTEVDAISAAFIFNPEYSNRNRNNTQFVTDMYYSFLRRGGDAGGVNFWINQLNTNQMNINTVRTNFLGTAEFGARVQAVINAGCYTGP